MSQFGHVGVEPFPEFRDGRQPSARGERRPARRRGRAVTGTAIALLGAVLLPVGVGLGLPWADHELLSVPALAGLLALGLGVVATVGGSARLLRAVGRWWWIVLVPALAAGVLLTTVTGATALLATVAPPTPLGAVAGGALGPTAREVSFPAADGTRLAGWYLPSTNGAAVAVLHGSHANRSAVLAQGRVLARHGYGVLLYDARGHGRSAGRPMDLGWAGENDLAGAVTYLLARQEVRDGKVAALGESMGGEQAIGALGADPRLRAAVAEGATARVPADLSWLSDAYGWRGLLTEAVHHLGARVTALLTPVPPPAPLARAVQRAAPRPLLLIASGTHPDEGRAAEVLRGTAPSVVTVWTVPGAGHTEGVTARAAEWESRVIGFLDRALVPTPATTTPATTR